MFITGQYVKIRFKNRGSPCYFLSSRGQKIKTITKIEQKILLLFTFSVSFFVVCFAQKLIYTIHIWFNFAFGSFFEQDHLLNLIIFVVYFSKFIKRCAEWCALQLCHTSLKCLAFYLKVGDNLLILNLLVVGIACFDTAFPILIFHDNNSSSIFVFHPKK